MTFPLPEGMFWRLQEHGWGIMSVELRQRRQHWFSDAHPNWFSRHLEDVWFDPSSMTLDEAKELCWERYQANLVFWETVDELRRDLGDSEE